MKLKNIKSSNVKNYLVLFVDKGDGTELFCVSENQYERIGSPLIGDEITDGQYGLLSSLKEEWLAVKRALNILSYGDNSRSSLFAKLRKAGFSSDVSKRTVEQMVVLGYIDEKRQLRRLISYEVNKSLSGPRKFTSKLYSKGYSAASIREVTEELIRSGEIDFAEARRALVEKYSPTTEEEEKALYYKRGF